MKLLVAVTGASCLPIAIRLLDVLGQARIERHLVVSEGAQNVARYDSEQLIRWHELGDRVYLERDPAASICSGSYPIDGAVVVPCSMNTLGHIAHGLEHNTITRAVAVNIKQQRPVILVTRETPLSLIHLENMRCAKLAGCSILPPTMGFYFSPDSISDMVDHIVGKILELLKVPHQLYPIWQGATGK